MQAKQNTGRGPDHTSADRERKALSTGDTERELYVE